jgi:transcriptional regulator CtsR
VEAVHAVTKAVNCRFCFHPHYLVEPRRGGGGTSPIVLPNGKDSLAIDDSASGDISGRTSMSDGAQRIECEAQTETTKGEQPMAVTIG